MRGVRTVGSAAIVGAALLGASLVVFDDSPLPRIGLLAGGVALLGGLAARSVWLPVAGRVAIAALIVVGARLFAGLEGSIAAAVLVSVGWLLRLHARDALWALAVYGLALAVASGVSIHLVLTFALLGGAAVGVTAAARKAAARSSAGPGPVEPLRVPERPAAAPEEVVP